MSEIRILIVDDHPVFRYGMRALLQSEPDFEVVGEAANGTDAVELAKTLVPDVVLMDLNLPEMSGIEATRRIIAESESVAVLVVTMLDDDSVFAAVRAGACGYLLKGAEGEETLRAIRAVAGGEAIFSPTAARRLITYFGQANSARIAVPFPELTGREREILDLLARGLTNQAIADRFHLSPKTVRNQVSSIFAKLQVAGRAEAIIRARQAGLGDQM